MSHITHNFDQGSPEWDAHRRSHFNASEAAAMLGISPKVKRNELLHFKKTLSDKEFSKWVQENIIDPGHEFEAAAKVFATEIIGEDLFKTTCSLIVDGLPLSASYDGKTMGDDVTWEHKRLNKELAESLRAGVIPEEHLPQLEQQLLISGAKKCLFMASDGTRENMLYAWYESTPRNRAMLIAGWKQFAIDLENYTPTEEKAPIVARPVTELPAVVVNVKGAIEVADNFKLFETALKDFIENQLIKEPKTDQDFADLDLQIKALIKAEDALDAEEARMLSQIGAIDACKRMKDMLHAMARTNRLASEKLLKAKKESIRNGIVLGAQTAWNDHVAQVNETLGGKITLPIIPSNFAEVIKNKRTLVSLQDAVDTELARVKIEANRIADQIRVNLASLNDLAADYKFLFMDAQQLVMKANEDLVSLIKVRIADHKAAEQKKEDEQRARIQKEEQEKAEKAAREKVEQERRQTEAAEKKREPVQSAPEFKADEPEQRQAPATTASQPAPQRTPISLIPSAQARPTDAELIRLVMDEYDVDEQTAIDWLMAFQFKAVG